MHGGNINEVHEGNAVARETGCPNSNRSPFRFTIVDLLVTMAFVAVIFALPTRGVAALVVGAIVLVIVAPCLLFFTMFSARNRAGRDAKIERNLIRFMFRVFVYSFAVFVVGGFAIAAQAWK